MLARLTFALVATTMAVGAQAATKPDCTALTRLSLPDTTLKITGAEHVAPAAAAKGTAALPGYCKVSGIIDARTGADGKAYGIGFELALPDDWQGRFLYQGGGGLNGTIRPPVGATAAGDRGALARGYAVVSTDSGHKGAVFDSSFNKDQRAALDFAGASVGTLAPIAKRIVAAYYGRPIAHAYFVGCSTGGREGMLSAERYPEMFDGIVVGSPAMRTGFSNLALTHAAVAFNQAAKRDAEGLPIAESIFSASDRTLIVNGILNACDALDGLKDGVIDNPRQCHFKPATLQCTEAKAEGCLSSAQVKALDEAFSAPRDSTGAPLYAAFPYDTGIAAEGGGIPGFLVNSGKSPLGPRTRALTIDTDALARTVRADAAQTLTATYGWTNLSTFLGHGGKIIFYHGMSDPWFSPWDTLDYYQRAGDTNGAERWSAASRFYLVPGMGHCGGGANTFDHFDMLGAVSDWVERGAAPSTVIASRTTGAPATRPLCPLPAHAQYKGSGDPTKATSFECQMPTAAN